MCRLHLDDVKICPATVYLIDTVLQSSVCFQPPRDNPKSEKSAASAHSWPAIFHARSVQFLG